MRNPYLYGYLPLFSILLFSVTFGIYTVGITLDIFSSIGIYAGMREFLSDLELKIFLLVVISLFYFMLFSALKLIGETIHEIGMLLFSKDKVGETVHAARGGYVIFFFGAIISSFAIQSLLILVVIFGITTITYFIFNIYKMSKYLSYTGLIGLTIFELLIWAVFIISLLFVGLKLYNGILASLPFAN